MIGVLVNIPTHRLLFQIDYTNSQFGSKVSSSITAGLKSPSIANSLQQYGKIK